MDIVEYAPQHRAALIELWQACDLTRPWNDPGDDIDRAVRHSASTIWLGILDGRLVGSVMCGYDGHRGWVYYVAADPALRGQKIASRLMRKAEDWLRDLDCPKVELLVRTTNTQALGFYERLGYQHQAVSTLAKWLIEPEVPQD